MMIASLNERFQQDNRSTLQIENNINYNHSTRSQDRMRIGHRRTQSSHITNAAHEEPLFQKCSHSYRKSQICKLLDQSEAKFKEKICSIEQLDTSDKQEKGNLFNFGKRLLGSNLEHQENKKRNCLQLDSIPQKCKQHSAKCKRTPQTEVSSKKQKERKKSIIKISVKPKVIVKASPFEEINHIIKIKMGIDEANYKKYSPYFTEKPSLKSLKHKKEIPNVK